MVLPDFGTHAYKELRTPAQDSRTFDWRQPDQFDGTGGSVITEDPIAKALAGKLPLPDPWPGRPGRRLVRGADVSAVEPPVKKLILHIEVPDINVDDLPESMEAAGMDPSDPGDTMEVVIGADGMIREEVGLTIVTMPDEKCMNDDFGVYAYTCRVVGAEIVDRQAGDR